MFPWVKKPSVRKASSKQWKNRTNPYVDRLKMTFSRMSISNLEESLNTTADFEETMDCRHDHRSSSVKGKKGFVKKIFTKVFDKKFRAKEKQVETVKCTESDENLDGGSTGSKVIDGSANDLMDGTSWENKVFNETISQPGKSPRKRWDLPLETTRISEEWRAFIAKMPITREEDEVNSKKEPDGSEHVRASDDSSGYFSGSRVSDIENRKREQKCSKRKKFRSKKILKMLHLISKDKQSPKSHLNSTSLGVSRDFGLDGTLFSTSSVSSLVTDESGFYTSSPIRSIGVGTPRRSSISPLTSSKEVKVYHSTPRIKIMLKFDEKYPNNMMFSKTMGETNFFGAIKEISKSLENLQKTSPKSTQNRIYTWPTSEKYAMDVSESVADFFEEMAKIQRQEKDKLNDESVDTTSEECLEDNSPQKRYFSESTRHYEKRSVKLSVDHSPLGIKWNHSTSSLSLDRIYQSHHVHHFSFVKNKVNRSLPKYETYEDVSLDEDKSLRDMMVSQIPERNVTKTLCCCYNKNECTEECPNFLNSVRLDFHKMSMIPNKQPISKSTVDISERWINDSHDDPAEFISLHNLACVVTPSGSSGEVGQINEKIEAENWKVTAVKSKSEFQAEKKNAVEEEIEYQNISIDFDEEEEIALQQFGANNSSYIITMYV